MRLLFLLFISILGASLSGQSEYHFTVNPNIDTLEQPNPLLISNLEQFLSTKNNDLASNTLWDSTDFDRYKYPFKSIYWIETGWPKKYNYNPSLTAIVPAGAENQYILKLAFMETQNENSVFLKAIYNIMASVEDDKVVFSSYTSYATQDWQQESLGSFTYLSSPARTFSMEDARKQEEFAEYLSKFFGITKIPILYYSCVDLEEMFNIMGYDYNWQMYLHETGGQVGFNNILYSGNNRDIYKHEVVHIYLASYFSTKWNSLLNEGIATYMGGSGELTFQEHRANLAKYVAEHPDFDFTDHLNPYNQFFIDKDTPVSYTIGALVCEMAYRKGGKKLLFKTVAEPENTKAFGYLDISMEDLNERLKDELKKEAVLLDFPE